MIPPLATPHLTLRAFTESDIAELHDILSEPDMLRYFPDPNPPSPERVRRLIESQLADWARHGYGWWAVDLRPSGAFIGWCGLGYLPKTDETEVAYLLGKPYWGRGLATEAAKEAKQRLSDSSRFLLDLIPNSDRSGGTSRSATRRPAHTRASR